MSYTYSTLGGSYAAIKLLSSGQLHHYAFDKDGATYAPFNPDSYEIDKGFSSYDKYMALQTSTNRNEAGFGSISGNDVADMMSSGPFIINPGDSVIVAFALIAGDNLADIQNSAIEVNNIYNNTGINELKLNSTVQLSDIYPNPTNGTASVDIYLPASMVVDLSLFDNTGKKLITISCGEFAQGHHTLIIQTKDLTSGIYHLRLSCGNIVLSKDVTIIK